LIKFRIAKRYARALFELAQQDGRIEEVGRDLDVVDSLFSSEAAIHAGLISPVTSSEAKAEILDALIDAAGIDKMVGNFLRVLLDARKMAVLPQIATTYSAMSDDAAGKVRGVALAPIALDDEALTKMAAALSKALDKEVILESQQDPSLLGGVVARVGNLVFDASVRTQLQRMKDSLIKG
jgi:F-type H+-transporting ATPase subunit delta